MSLDICSSNHDEIVYDGRTCPICAALEELKVVQGEVELIAESYFQLQTEFDEFKDHVIEIYPECAI